MAEYLTNVMRKGGAVFFGGAGVSTGSGIPDFRGAKGLEEKYGEGSVESILSATYFYESTRKFYKFYRESLLVPDAKPSKAHIALARFEESGCLNAVITQNVDGLHQKAGSRNVFELHGSADRNSCMDCGAVYDARYVHAFPKIVPECGNCGGILKPRVTLYEEQLDMAVLGRAVRAIEKARSLIIGGTSLAVYPAAGLIERFSGEEMIIINARPTPFDGIASRIYRCDINRLLWEAANKL